MKTLAAAITALVPFALAAPASADHTADHVVSKIESAHGKDAYYAKDAVEVDLLVEGFGGLRLDGTMTFTPSLSKVRFALDDGTTLIYNDGEAWMTPSSAEMPPAMARFHVLTWPYFVAVPFKLRDPGVRLGEPEALPVHGPDDAVTAVKLSFGAGVGDAPDDWYYLLPEEDGKLEALSYIVTYSESQEEAEKRPSVVLYDDFRTIDGVTLPFEWEFHFWTRQDGVVSDEPKGTATVRSIRFVTPTDAAFAEPADATPLPAP